MDPETMRVAQEQFSRMSPEQLEELRRVMPNYSPEVMRASQEQMKNMTPEQWQQAMEQMRSMSSEDMVNQIRQANPSRVNSQFSARIQYELSAAKQLKEEGNALHRAGNFKDAAEKYSRAKQNLSLHVSEDAKVVRKACTLNLASCHIKMGEFSYAIESCSEVLAVDRLNPKALYRRGQAHASLENWAEAVVDVRKAASCWPEDKTVSEFLRKLETELLAHNVNEADIKAAEEKIDEAIESSDRNASFPPSSASNFAFALEQMKNNPDLLEKMSAGLEMMSDSELESLRSSMPGMENATPEMVRAMGAQLKHMTSEDLERLSELAKSMPQGGSEEAQMQALQARMKDPETLKSMSKMMQNISPDQLKTMGRAMGKDFSEGEAERIAQAMKSMKPEHMEKMLKLMNTVQSLGTKAKKAKEMFLSRRALIVAIFVLLVAILLRACGLI